MDKNLKEFILKSTNSYSIKDISIIDSVWGGYGDISRVTLDDKVVIIKRINLINGQKKHPKGWNSIESHQRKVQSYIVEINWYKHYSSNFYNLKTPKYISSLITKNEIIVILEDMMQSNFSKVSKPSLKQIKLCINWIAKLHAQTLLTEKKYLWPIGSYWQLETRKNEFLNMTDNLLKDNAVKIHKKMQDAKFHSTIHGDSKPSNYLFNENEVVAVDFQYAGSGIGPKDLVTLLSSSFDNDELYRNEKECINYYFLCLTNFIIKYQKNIKATDVEKEWRELLDYAFCDYYRFLDGWSPNDQRLNEFAKSKIQKRLD